MINDTTDQLHDHLGLLRQQNNLLKQLLLYQNKGDASPTSPSVAPSPVTPQLSAEEIAAAKHEAAVALLQTSVAKRASLTNLEIIARQQMRREQATNARRCAAQKRPSLERVRQRAEPGYVETYTATPPNTPALPCHPDEARPNVPKFTADEKYITEVQRAAAEKADSCWQPTHCERPQAVHTCAAFVCQHDPPSERSVSSCSRPVSLPNPRSSLSPPRRALKAIPNACPKNLWPQSPSESPDDVGCGQTTKMHPLAPTYDDEETKLPSLPGSPFWTESMNPGELPDGETSLHKNNEMKVTQNPAQ